MALPQAFAQAISVSYFPQAVYQGTPATFRLEGPEGAVIEADLSGRPAEQLPVPPGGLEWNTRPDQTTTLRFSQGTNTQSFVFLAPGTFGGLSETDGFLHHQGVPAILVPTHRLPPELDRRWETGRLLRDQLLNSTPPLPTPLFLPAAATTNDLDQALARLSARPPVRFAPVPAFYPLHGQILAVPQRPAAFVVVEVSLGDLEAGMARDELLMKLQFLLQHLQRATGYRDGLLVSPAWKPDESARFAYLFEDLRVLALANHLRYVDRSLPREQWTARLLHHLGKDYRLP